MQKKQKLYFLSGTMCTAQLWDFVCDELPRFECVFIDTTSANSFNEIDALLNETLEENACVVAFSMGAYSAMHFAVSNPNRIEKMIMIAASANGLDAKELQLRKSTIHFLEKHTYKGISNARALQFLHPKNHQNNELIQVIKDMDAELGKEVLIRQLKATSLRVDLTHELKNIETKIHIIASKEDALVNINHVKNTQQRLPKATITVLKNCGHMIPLEMPDLVRNTILQFFI
ncbi:2-hydroxy-6-oxo-6-phenylhexa-2,4-dienoate hydrolase [Kordia antarctica]|uniref:2-hydroxy-6-oxo-6-phenylhexa-2,4-dienoate hydrolase n=1 Tax=Kordia antarctica TaxID=1218801 RepID=A0A7L4ZP28_9FLAO|nr:alpha/beta hydrolase [Kordia antarctica]QHI37956.1 2-hydroxy-6-oxo-6-phenylhexa-2,4-dienoate hydrolase [Kordia antarctica]